MVNPDDQSPANKIEDSALTGASLTPAPNPSGTEVSPRRKVPFRFRIFPWLDVDQGLHETLSDRNEHIKKLQVMVSDTQWDKVHEWMHHNLIVLDGKANSVLQFNSVTLASVTFIYGTLIAAEKSWLLDGLFLVTLALLLLTILPLAKLCYVFWSSSAEFANHGALVSELLRIRDARTRIVRQSVILTVATIFCFLALLVSTFCLRYGRSEPPTAPATQNVAANVVTPPPSPAPANDTPKPGHTN
jgi:hypothetical protein